MAMIRKTGRKGAAARFVKSAGGNAVRIARSGGRRIGPSSCNSTRAASNVKSYR